MTSHCIVTQELYAKGGRSFGDCPVFNAMLGAGIPVTFVGYYTWCSSTGIKFQKLPEQVQNWIRVYDKRLPVVIPFEFDIEWQSKGKGLTLDVRDIW